MKSILKLKKKIIVLIYGLFECPHSRKVIHYKRRLQRKIQKHWPDQEIMFEELVYESWDDQDIEKTPEKKLLNFIVFIDIDHKIDWIADFELPKETIVNIARAMAIEALPHEYLAKHHILSFKRLLGQAIAAAINEAHNDSVIMASKAIDFLKYRTTECSRQWALEFATLLISPIVLAALIFSQADYIAKNNEIPLFLVSIFWGIIGSYLSTARRIGKSELDASSGKWIHFLEISSKLIAGGAFGAIMYLILSTSLCPSAFDLFKNNIYGVSIAGFISGFCEYFIPNMVAVYNNNNTTNIKKEQ